MGFEHRVSAEDDDLHEVREDIDLWSESALIVCHDPATGLSVYGHLVLLEVVRSATGLPVPAVLRHERDPAWLGAPFFITPRLEGRAWPSDPPYNFSGWVLESPPAARAAATPSWRRRCAGWPTTGQAAATRPA